MTQRVRAGYRHHRRTSWVAALAASIVAALAALVLVMPAFAADHFSDPTTQGVVPTLQLVGGSNFSCTANTNGVPSGMSSFQINNPPNTATTVNYNLGGGVSLAVTGVNGADAGKKFSFSMTGGGTVYHVGVNGGSNTAEYNYVPKGGVTSDGALHATSNNQGKLNVASWTTFCYKVTTTIKGRVFLDNNGDGTFNTTSSPADVGQTGWTVKLFDTTAGTQFGPSLTTTSPSTDPVGSYTFTNVPVGGNYKVCVTPPASSPPGSWDQSAPSGTDCSNVSGALPAGRVIQNLPAGGETDQDFGNQPTIAPSCTEQFGPDVLQNSQIVEYTAQLTNPDGSDTCKPAVVMYSYLDGSQPYAIIHPTASSGTNTFWVVERIRMMVDKGAAQNPVTMKYDDSKPYGSAYTTMKMCKSDPRVPGDDFKLAGDPADVMPDGTTADGGPHTTCMIQSTDLPSEGVTDLDTGATYNYEAYMATDVDGIKQPT